MTLPITLGQAGTTGRVISDQYYDRTPSNVTKSFINVAGPHGATTRTTYTCPSGRKAFLASYLISIRRVTVATTGAAFQVFISYFPNLLPAVDINVLTAYTNAASDPGVQAYASEVMTLYAGDQITTEDLDSSTAGTIQYDEGMIMTEFDA